MLDTSFSKEITMDFRLEHPRPELYRDAWLSLNGVWEFDFLDGVDIKDYNPTAPLGRRINIPFCPESRLSGIADTAFHTGAMYRRSITIPDAFLGKRIILHIEACDYLTRVYVNGRICGEHKGGYTPFSFDITEKLTDGENCISVLALDDTKSPRQMTGKQSAKEHSYGCFYTRTTGIWQTVWLEAVNDAYVKSYRTAPNIHAPSVEVTLNTSETAIGCTATLTAKYSGRDVGIAKAVIERAEQKLTLPLSELHLWELGAGRLYDMEIELWNTEGDRVDFLSGYFGMREVKLLDDGIHLCGERVFGRFVLDQGFYPDGIYTAPSDAALENDIKNAMALGFNGARMHQKIFEPRYIYHADKLGFMLFGESACWGLDYTDPENKEIFLDEWRESLIRDAMHPSIIAWCPFNETWDIDGRRQCDEMIDSAYLFAKEFDKTRFVITNSGSNPSELNPLATDAYDIHEYEQNPDMLREYYAEASSGIIKCQLWRENSERQKYNGLPVFMSEYGGIKWTEDKNSVTKKGKADKSTPEAVADTEAWGYGADVRSEDEFFARLEGLTHVILENGIFFGFCYTQLYDVEQEQNGMMTYDRRFKFPPEKIKKIIAKERKITT